ncbi:MAG TPA: type VI secretion system tube protein Hcp [Verrucomicrobiota bacterium]|nr:type VI secretion system tube protein Hcp [Verrucomicrobiota bacterium]
MKRLFQRLAWVTPLFVALAVHAGFDAYLKIEGIPGEAEGKKEFYKGWIELNSFSTPFHPGGPATTATATLHFTKLTDKSSPLLFAQCAAGIPVPWARLELVKTNPSVVRVFDIRMTDVIISSAFVENNPGSADDRPMESLSLNFTKIEWTYTLVRQVSQLPAESRSTSADLTTGISGGSTNAATFTVTGIRKESGEAVLNWQGVAGKTYDVYACPSLDGPFSFQGQVTATADGPMSHTTPIQPGNMFFAVEERP